MMKAFLYCDGGSRCNPGDAGIGFVIKDEHGANICCGSAFLGQATNNVAEYSALIWGLHNCRELGIEHLEVRADSNLVVNQLKGLFKVKNEGLKPLYSSAYVLSLQFKTVNFQHVYRDDNTEADSLANIAMDTRSMSGNFKIPWSEQLI